MYFKFFKLQSWAKRSASCRRRFNQRFLKLKNIVGIDTLLLEGGSILNGAFQRAGVIDELSLVVDPVIGGEGKPLCMDSSMEEYRLVDLKNHNGILWMNYKR